ncbi:Uncharacterised protein [Campylobacter hyointestinalis subsp. hyointestinalis]|uniref:Winged helix-turn-helix domain-containing protein n=1 Tax=Campylobacter hyointestinalis subsp. hyointestinalis TaxID=91352 RepID=A0A0S4SLT9_CAMHY|nr:helix-turn-helix domain-containing protein [Campylobacter hyointestinalis]PPB51693.1 hypothetical protein CDQ69_08815 [Campylobacter hyointestinalis subsp. hyointestinalis]PPB55992.1 hypothetical protein CDQ67_01775 [Campylobacter hyointestinalis subsp. hyointestinalis]CUU71321.1 Uncharacterised protein [Campylobacter hyointestinalis subsp. hyointestinalis]CUU87500.1 Uncharacterised protein [Campylobacter hyointestinalis subsp. hyointestinalis]
MTYKKKKEMLLTYLQKGYSINNIVALRELAINSAQLYYLIHTLKKEGWEIRTNRKNSKYAPVAYKEYELSPNWRLASEVEKREKLKGKDNSKELDISKIRIGMRVREKCKGYRAGKVVAIFADDFITFEDELTGVYTDVPLNSIRKF